MTDYIKREDAKNAVMDTEPVYAMCKDGIAEVAYQKTVDVIEMIDAIPSADVAPVRHGGWEKNDNLFIDTLYRCSVCGEEFYIENGTPQENQYYYCPNCGARMDAKK